MADHYLQPYRDAVTSHGPGFKATLWASEKTQRLRFDIFALMCDVGGKRVLDAGCGQGDFAAYLIEHRFKYKRFVGLDGLAEVIEVAQRRGLARAEFRAGDFVAEPTLLSTRNPQIIAISGALNTMDDHTALGVLQHAWSAASEVLLFNFLSDRALARAPAQGDPARRMPTVKLIDWALSCASNVQFRQDYFPNGHDATIMMRKE